MQNTNPVQKLLLKSEIFILAQRVSSLIYQLNSLGEPVIFLVTGINGSGKTLVSHKLLRLFPFYQVFSLGTVTRTLKESGKLAENNSILVTDRLDNSPDWTMYERTVLSAVNHYHAQGVNTLIEGVQINTAELTMLDQLMGGVILSAASEVIARRSVDGSTRLHRKLSPEDLPRVDYRANKKFMLIDNNGTLDETLAKVIRHLDNLLAARLTNVISTKHYRNKNLLKH